VSLAGKKAEELALISELQEHVKSTTAPYKYPRKIDLVDSLPKVKVPASRIVYK
jgi:acyl-coenzyme A synthetase/AMP-(fatty) acid ligase